MRRVLRCLTVGAIGAVALIGSGVAVSAGPNLIVNGSFESPDIPTGTADIFPSIPGWSFAPRAGATSSGIEIQDHSSGAPAAGAGDQFVELDSDGPYRIYQDVATQAGSTYQLEFLYSARPNTAAVENQFQVTAGLATLVIGPLPSGTETNWLTGTLVFVASGSTSRIEFLDLGPQQAEGGIGAYIDEVSLAPASRPPDCSEVSASPSVLWPPNHKLKTVTVAGATDPDGDAVTVTITGVTQDEPVNGVGDGNTSPDVVTGASADQVQLRAERSGRGDGRLYVIAYTATDPGRASCSGTVTVSVPHDKRSAQEALRALSIFRNW
jgi:hypothetical protein